MAPPFATVEEVVGKPLKAARFKSCFATCMFNSAGCCTTFTFTPELQPDGTLLMTKNSFCFGMARMSPIPCCNGCGYGPCAFTPKFKKVSETEWHGLEDAANIGGGCCKCCFSEKGSQLILKGDEWIYHAGGALANPPCLQNSDVAVMELAKPATGAPAAEMER